MKTTKLTPNMMVKDVSETVGYYTKRLGFTLRMAVPEDMKSIAEKIEKGTRYVYALVAIDNVEIMFQEAENLRNDITVFQGADIGATVSFYFEVEGVDDLYNILKNEVEVVKEISTTWYGMREFYIRDCNGYIIGFAEQQ